MTTFDTADSPTARRSHTRLDVALVTRLLPILIVAALACGQAWRERGTFQGRDWLAYGIGAGLVLVVVLAAGAAARPGRWALAGLASAVGLAVWYAVSTAWSAAPAFARDDALLAAVYAVTFALPLVTLRSLRERGAAIRVLVLALGALCMATLLRVGLAGEASDVYFDGRLFFPVSYPNGEAAIALLAFWPAVALAASRNLPVAVRGLALAGAEAMLCCWLLTQSKGGGLGLIASAAVFFAVAPRRLRALVPTLVAAVPPAVAVAPLTAPFRADRSELLDSIRGAGTLALVLTVAVGVAGVVYAAADRWLDVSARARRRAGVIVAATLLASTVASVATFFVIVDRPGDFFGDKWRAFKTLPTERTVSTHLLSLGSNRYDFWRLSLDAFERHPVAGIGDRGFAALYLERGRSRETPQHAHSLQLEELAENGIVGFALLLGALGLPLLVLARRATASLGAAATLAGAAQFLAHASVDWIWALPSVGLVFFLLLGIGSSGDEPPPLRRRAALGAAALAAALVTFGLAPPWLSSRSVDRAYANPAGSAERLRWARRLDPLSTQPLIAEAVLMRSVPALEEVVRREPRQVAHRVALGRTYLRLGRASAAHEQFRIAHQLFPRDAEIARLVRASR